MPTKIENSSSISRKVSVGRKVVPKKVNSRRGMSSSISGLPPILRIGIRVKMAIRPHAATSRRRWKRPVDSLGRIQRREPSRFRVDRTCSWAWGAFEVIVSALPRQEAAGSAAAVAPSISAFVSPPGAAVRRAGAARTSSPCGSFGLGGSVPSRVADVGRHRQQLGGPQLALPGQHALGRSRPRGPCGRCPSAGRRGASSGR